MKHPPCKSYQARETVCADGFVQRPYCTGKYGCPMCGRTDDRVLPSCLKDEIPQHHSTPNGKPLFYKESRDAS